jgi:ABC-2 type transport system permease protein
LGVRRDAFEKARGLTMWQRVHSVFRLGVKELYSLRRDPVLMFLIVWTFTFAVYEVARGVDTEVRNASIAVVDEDGSELSRRIADSFLPPYFQSARQISHGEIDGAMDRGRYSFIIDIPPHFQADVEARRSPAIQLNVDATAMTLAGNGSGYIQSIINQEILNFQGRSEVLIATPVTASIRARFNPNLQSSWFSAVMQLINAVTVLAIVLTGAAVIREREHGTLEHLLVMPLTAGEIMLAKVCANGLVIVVSAVLSLVFVVGGLLQVPITAKATTLFALGASVYIFSVTSLGIMLATLARSMPQFGLLSIPVFVVMEMLSGGVTPLENMPRALQAFMQAVPSTHFTSFSQAVLYRGAGLDVVWLDLLAIAGLGAVFFLAALARFRATISATR